MDALIGVVHAKSSVSVDALVRNVVHASNSAGCVVHAKKSFVVLDALVRSAVQFRPWLEVLSSSVNVDALVRSVVQFSGRPG